jgi:hypothetical protein
MQYQSQHPVLRTGRRLLRLLARQELIDVVLVTVALLIFGSVVIYILDKRMKFFTPTALRAFLPSEVAAFVIRGVGLLGRCAKVKREEEGRT